MTGTDDELTRDERRAFESLPREATPPAELRARTKLRLQEAGRLGPHGERHPSSWGWARAAAVLFLTFGLGYTAGQFGRLPTGRGAAFQIGASLRDAETIQHVGTSYAEALAGLQRTYRSNDPSDEAARAAAITTFLATLEQVNRLAGQEAVPPEATATLRALLGTPERVDMGWF